MKIARQEPVKKPSAKPTTGKQTASSSPKKTSAPEHRKPAGVQGGKQGMRVLKVAIVAVIVIAIVGAIAYFGYNWYQDKQYEDKVNAVAAGATGIVDDINAVLASNAPSTWVYDRDENLIMTLKTSEALQAVDTVPEVLSQAIVQKSNGDVVGTIVSEYLYSKAIAVEDGVYDGYRRCLQTNISQQDMIRFLATTSMYAGTYTGASDASFNYFGVSLSQLNADQQEFIAYTYRNEDADIEQYMQDKNTNEERLGLVIFQSEYSAVRSKLLQELESIEGVDVAQNSYMIKLSTSTQQQSILQTAIDQGMRQLIDLNADGTYAFDCSVVLVDRNSGYVRAYIPGRSCSVLNAKPFMMNVLNYRDNFATLYQQLLDKYSFGFTLREVTKPNGDKELQSLEQLFYSQGLASSKSLDLVDSITLLRSLYAESERFTGVTMIHQVLDTQGQTLYRASGKSVLDINNNNLCQFFSTDNDLKYFSNMFDMDTGVVYFKSTADYTAVIIAGSGAVGGTVTTDQRVQLHSMIENLDKAIAGFYPTPVNPVWNGAGMDSAMSVCHMQNQKYVETAFTSELDALSAIVVDSYTTRVEFENKYESINKFISDYEVFVGEVYADGLREALQAIRLERAEVLMRYSV